MIAHLRGTVVEFRPGQLVLMVGGVGYLVTATPAVLEGLAIGGEVHLRVKQVVKEDSLELYGFDSATEEHAFESLISVPQVGAKMAMKLLNHMTANNFWLFLETRNVQALTLIKGIGPKVAQRIVDKLGRKAA